MYPFYISVCLFKAYPNAYLRMLSSMYVILSVFFCQKYRQWHCDLKLGFKSLSADTATSNADNTNMDLSIIALPLTLPYVGRFLKLLTISKEIWAASEPVVSRLTSGSVGSIYLGVFVSIKSLFILFHTLKPLTLNLFYDFQHITGFTTIAVLAVQILLLLK